MNGIRELDDGNYRSALGRGLTLVDFWAPCSHREDERR